MSKKNKKKGDVVPMEDFVDAEIVQTEEETEMEKTEEVVVEEKTPKSRNWKKIALVAGGVLTGIGILGKTMWDTHQLNQYRALAALTGEIQDPDDSDEEDDEDDDGDETEEE